MQSLSSEAERVAEQSRTVALQSSQQLNKELSLASLDSSLVAAMKSVVGRFDDKAYSAMSFEQFDREVRRQQKSV